MSEKNLSYETIDDTLLKIDAITGAAEAHGTLCGMICISGNANLENWLEHILGEDDSKNIQLDEYKAVLDQLHNKTLTELIEQNYALTLLIHDDNESLDMRIEDLCNWCQGFLFGLSAAGLKDIKKLPTDASEILQDMMDISKAGYDPEENEEENEAAFAEILEYIRVGVYIIFSTFNGDGITTSTSTMH